MKPPNLLLCFALLSVKDQSIQTSFYFLSAFVVEAPFDFFWHLHHKRSPSSPCVHPDDVPYRSYLEQSLDMRLVEVRPARISLRVQVLEHDGLKSQESVQIGLNNIMDLGHWTL